MWLLSSVEIASGLWSWFDVLVLLVVAIVSVCFVCHSAFAQIEAARQKVRDERFGSATLDHFNAPQSLADDEYVKPFAGQSAVANAVTKLTELALRDFVFSWYTPMTDNQSFPNHLRTLIDVALSRLASRAAKVDWSVFVIESVVPNLTDLLRIYTVSEKELSRYPEYLTASEERKEEMLKDAITKIYTLHSAASSDKAAISYLRKVAMVLLSRLLNRRDFQCDTLRSFLRELIAVKVLFPVLGFAIPYWFNVALVMSLGEAPPSAPLSSSLSSSSDASAATASATTADTINTSFPESPSTPAVGPKEKGTRILDSLLRVISEGYFTDASSSTNFPAAMLSPSAATSSSYDTSLPAASASWHAACLVSPASSSPPSPSSSFCSSMSFSAPDLGFPSSSSSSSSTTTSSSSFSSSSSLLTTSASTVNHSRNTSCTSSASSSLATISSSNASSSLTTTTCSSSNPSLLCSAISIIVPTCANTSISTSSSSSNSVSPFLPSELLSDNESEREEGDINSLRIIRSLSSPFPIDNSKKSHLSSLTLTVNTDDRIGKEANIVRDDDESTVLSTANKEQVTHDTLANSLLMPPSPLPPLRRSNTLPEEKHGFFRLPGLKKSLASVMRLRSNSSVVHTSPPMNAPMDEEGGSEVSWNVQITGALSRYDPKPYWSYQLRVQRDNEERYHISKRYGQFEDLHKKLKKSHNFDAMLPTKRMFGNLDPIFVQARKVELQHYMDRLLSIRSIANSLTIDEFLRNSAESPSLNRKATIDHSHRRSKPPTATDPEQDEHSSPPSPVSTSQPASLPSTPASHSSSSSSSLSSSASHSFSAGPNPTTSSSNTAHVPVLSHATITESVPIVIPLSEDPACLPRTQHNAEPLFDFVDELFQLKKGWGVRASTLGMVRGFSRLALNEPVFGWLSKQIEGAITPAELVIWIEWAQLKLWPDDQLFVAQPDPSAEELRKYRQEAKACLRDTVPSSLFKLIGDKQVAQGVHKLFTLFQIESLTRHLAYTCLDNLLLELFPDMQTNLRRCR